MERFPRQFDEVVSSGNARQSSKMSVTTATEVVVASNGVPSTMTTVLRSSSSEVVINGGLTGTFKDLHSSATMHSNQVTPSEVAAAAAERSFEHITSTQTSLVSELTPPARSLSPKRRLRAATSASAPVLDQYLNSDGGSPRASEDWGYERRRRHSGASSVASWLPIYRERMVHGFGFWKCDKVFPDAEEMKRKVRKSITEEGPLNRDIYKKIGFCQSVVRSHWFEWTTLVVIFTNAIWIAIDADLNEAVTLVEASWYFQLAENLFCAFFFVEWIVRFLALDHKSYIIFDRWFLFDSVLALMSVMETWIMTTIFAVTGFHLGSNAMRSTLILRLIRLFRLMRLSRMVRLMRALPELVFMVRGMLAAARSVFITMVLLFCILYCFGIAFRQMSEGTEMGEEYFGTVLESMYTLLIAGTLLDNVTLVVAAIGRDSYACATLFFVVILLAALTVMNMLIGVTCEVVSNVARTEKERAAVSFVKERMWHTLWQGDHLDADNDGLISKDEFRRLIETPQAFKALRDVGVDVLAMVDLAELIFQSDSRGKEYEKKLNFHEFMEIVLQLRGCNPATVKDIVDLRRFLHLENTTRNNTLARMEEREKIIESRLSAIEHKLDKLLKQGEEGRRQNANEEGNRSAVRCSEPGPRRRRSLSAGHLTRRASSPDQTGIRSKCRTVPGCLTQVSSQLPSRSPERVRTRPVPLLRGLPEDPQGEKSWSTSSSQTLREGRSAGQPSSRVNSLS